MAATSASKSGDAAGAGEPSNACDWGEELLSALQDSDQAAVLAPLIQHHVPVMARCFIALSTLPKFQALFDGGNIDDIWAILTHIEPNVCHLISEDDARARELLVAVAFFNDRDSGRLQALLSDSITAWSPAVLVVFTALQKGGVIGQTAGIVLCDALETALPDRISGPEKALWSTVLGQVLALPNVGEQKRLRAVELALSIDLLDDIVDRPVSTAAGKKQKQKKKQTAKKQTSMATLEAELAAELAAQTEEYDAIWQEMVKFCSDLEVKRYWARSTKHAEQHKDCGVDYAWTPPFDLRDIYEKDKPALPAIPPPPRAPRGAAKKGKKKIAAKKAKGAEQADKRHEAALKAVYGQRQKMLDALKARWQDLQDNWQPGWVNCVMNAAEEYLTLWQADQAATRSVTACADAIHSLPQVEVATVTPTPTP